MLVNERQITTTRTYKEHLTLIKYDRTDKIIFSDELVEYNYYLEY